MARLKLDCGEYGKFLAPNDGYLAVLDFVASKIGCSRNDIQLHLRDGEELWEVDGAQWDLVQAGDALAVLTAQGDILRKVELDRETPSVSELPVSRASSSSRTRTDQGPALAASEQPNAWPARNVPREPLGPGYRMDDRHDNSYASGSYHSYRQDERRSASDWHPRWDGRHSDSFSYDYGHHDGRERERERDHRSRDRDSDRGPPHERDYDRRHPAFTSAPPARAPMVSSPPPRSRPVESISSGRQASAPQDALPQPAQVRHPSQPPVRARPGPLDTLTKAVTMSVTHNERTSELERERRNKATRIELLDAALLQKEAAAEADQERQRQEEAMQERKEAEQLDSVLENIASEPSSGKRWSSKESDIFARGLASRLKVLIQENAPLEDLSYERVFRALKEEHPILKGRSTAALRTRLSTMVKKAGKGKVANFDTFIRANARGASKRARAGSASGSLSGLSEDEDARTEARSKRVKKMSSTPPHSSKAPSAETSASDIRPLRNSSFSNAGGLLSMGAQEDDESAAESSTESTHEDLPATRSGQLHKRPLSKEEEERRIAQTRKDFEEKNPFPKIVPAPRKYPPPIPKFSEKGPPSQPEKHQTPASTSGVPPLAFGAQDWPQAQPPLNPVKAEKGTNDYLHGLPPLLDADIKKPKTVKQLAEMEKWRGSPAPRLNRNLAVIDLQGLRMKDPSLLERAQHADKERLREDIKGYISSKLEHVDRIEAFPYKEVGDVIASMVNQPEHTRTKTGDKEFPSVIYAVYEQMFLSGHKDWSIRKVAMCATILLIFIGREILDLRSGGYNNSMPSDKHFKDGEKNARAYLTHRRFRAYLQSFLLEGCEVDMQSISSTPYAAVHPRDALAALVALRPNAFRPDLILTALSKRICEVPEAEINGQLSALANLDNIIIKCRSCVEMFDKSPWLVEDHLSIRGGQPSPDTRWETPLRQARDEALPRITAFADDDAVIEKAEAVQKRIDDLHRLLEASNQAVRKAARLENRVITLQRPQSQGESLTETELEDFIAASDVASEVTPVAICGVQVENQNDILVVVLESEAQTRQLNNLIQRSNWRAFRYKFLTHDAEMITMQRVGAAVLQQEAQKLAG